MRDFQVAVPEAVLADLRDRLDRTRWPDQIPDSGWRYGTDRSYLQELCSYWRHEFDWRAVEERLNQWPQVLVDIQGQQFHALHVVSPHAGATPLLLVHGWPGSVLEFLDVIGPLVDPPAHGGQAADAFSVVCPSLPGYTWSGPTTEPGWDVRRTAGALVELMAAFGYARFGYQGGDWGALIGAAMGAAFPDRLQGLHLNLAPIPVPSDPSAFAGLTEEELASLAASREFQRHETGYSAIQGTKPQTLAYGLNDSPAGLAAWMVEKFRSWSDCGGDVEQAFTRDELLANITAYWVTATIGSSTRLYYESMRAGTFGAPADRVEVPTGVALFPKELLLPPRAWVAQHYDLRRWTQMPRGGHFAALEQPQLLVDDVRAFFRGLP
jgi:pimeloyl-ACP methyl ester carboxylesterase